MSNLKPDTAINNSLRLGNLTFDSRLIQAPLAGISCSAMRCLPWQFGGLAYTCSEMLSAHQLAYKLDRSPRYHHISPDEGAVCFQLSGNNPDIMAKATELAQNYGAQLIDLNAGCPMHKIRKKGCGSGLLAHARNMEAMLKAMRSAASCPLTVKIRVDLEIDNYNEAVLEAALNANVDGIIVHGRNWRSDYNTSVSYNEIKYFKDNCDIPVIANGDIEDLASAKRMLEFTSADGLMIARAAIGNPWLFREIDAGLKGVVIPARPSKEEKLNVFFTHLRKLIALENEYMACLQARRLVKHYFAAYEIAPQQLKDCYSAESLDDFRRVLLPK